MAFLDTSVLLYAVSREPAERGKARRANALLDAGEVTLSTQVLQEFYVQATRSSRPRPLRHEEALGLIETFLGLPVQHTTTGIVLAAMVTRERFGISYWDAAIIETSRAARCDLVLSEDLSDGADYGGVRVENPFART